MKQKENKNSFAEADSAGHWEKGSNIKKKHTYNLKEFIYNNSYCETCPRDIGKRCDCRW